MKNNNGVTIIELVVVMVIIAIGAILIAPTIGNWIPNYRLRGATRDVVSNLKVAQVKAVSTNLEYRVSFPDQSSFIIEYRTTAGNWISDGAQHNLPPGISFTNRPPGNPPNFQFNPDSTASTGSLTLDNGRGFSKTITVTTATGKINVNPPF